MISSRILNEVRGQWTNYHFRQHPPGVAPQEKLYDDSVARTAPLTQVYNFPSLSWGSNGNFYTTHRSREIRDDLTISLGQHTWKAGGDFQSLSFEGDNRPAIGTWTFRADQPFDPTNLAAFVPVAGSVQQFTASSAQAPALFAERDVERVRTGRMAAGLQRDADAGTRATTGRSVSFNETLDFNNPNDFPTTGTNLELPFVDLEARGDKDNWGPRVGLAWDLNDGRSVVRAGYGIYYNPNNIQIAGQEVNSLQQASVVIANPSYPDPYGGQDPFRFVSTAPQNITILANDLENLESRGVHGGSLAGALAVGGDPCGRRLYRDDQGPDGGRYQPADRRRTDCAPGEDPVPADQPDTVDRRGGLQGAAGASREAVGSTLHVQVLVHAGRFVRQPSGRRHDIHDDAGRDAAARRRAVIERPAPRDCGERIRAVARRCHAERRVQLPLDDAVQRDGGSRPQRGRQHHRLRSRNDPIGVQPGRQRDADGSGQRVADFARPGRTSGVADRYQRVRLARSSRQQGVLRSADVRRWSSWHRCSTSWAATTSSRPGRPMPCRTRSGAFSRR